MLSSPGSTRRKRARGPAAVFVLLVALVLPTLASGCSKPALPDAPPLVTARLGDQVVETVLAAHSWPNGGGQNVSDDSGEDGAGISPGQREVWMVLLSDYPLFVANNAEVTFTVSSPCLPDSVAVDLVTKLPEDRAIEPRDVGAEAHLEISEFVQNENGFSFTWRIPGYVREQFTNDRYVAIIDVSWAKRGGATATYYCLLAPGNGEQVASALRSALDWFSATWSGDRSRVSALVGPEVTRKLDEMEAGLPTVWRPNHNPFGVTLGDTWDQLMWKPDLNDFAPRGELKARLRNLGPWNGGGDTYASVDLFYSVDVTGQDGTTVRWDYTESVGLKESDDGWRVHQVVRNASPWLSGGATERGWAPASAKEGWLTKIGPFTDVSLFQERYWDDDRDTVAFVAENFGRSEVWTVKRDGSELKRVLTLDYELAPNNYLRDERSLSILGWVPGRPALRLIVAGYQTMGPHAGKIGLWIMEVDCADETIRDIGFIPKGPIWLQDLWVSRDVSRTVFRRSSDLYCVELATGEVKQLSCTVPATQWPPALHCSPSERYVAYWDSTGDEPEIVVADLDAGTSQAISVSDIPSGHTAFFHGWAPGDLLEVSIVEDDEVAPAYYQPPAAASELRLYAVSGQLVDKLSAPTGAASDRVANWAWSEHGDMMAFTVGPVQDFDVAGFAAPVPAQVAHSVWVWSNGENGRGAKRIAEVQGVVSEVVWVTDNAGSGVALEVWYRVPMDLYQPWPQDKMIQSGAIVSLQGDVETVKRRDPWAWAAWEEGIGYAQGYTYYLGSDRARSWISRMGRDGQTETVIELDSNLHYVRTPRVQDDILAFVWSSPSTRNQAYLCIRELGE